jgi:VIT1/CCC1 family predicted Fe2+/Mn2+ transporter
MAAGEYLATKSQDEVLTAELALEREHIRHHRGMELDQLRQMFATMGVDAGDLETVVAAFDNSDTTLLNAMKALEFGVVDSERRSPLKAMWFSGVLFLAGSLPSVLPFVFTADPVVGLVWASALASVGLFAVGVAKSRVTRGSAIVAGGENLIIAGLGGAAAYLVGGLVGRGIG